MVVLVAPTLIPWLVLLSNDAAPPFSVKLAALPAAVTPAAVTFNVLQPQANIKVQAPLVAYRIGELANW